MRRADLEEYFACFEDFAREVGIRILGYRMMEDDGVLVQFQRQEYPSIFESK